MNPCKFKYAMTLERASLFISHLVRQEFYSTDNKQTAVIVTVFSHDAELICLSYHASLNSIQISVRAHDMFPCILKQTHLGHAQTQTATGPDNHRAWQRDCLRSEQPSHSRKLFDAAVSVCFNRTEPQKWKKEEEITDNEREREQYREMFKSVYRLLTCAKQRKVYTAQEFKELPSEKERDNGSKAESGPYSKSSTLCRGLWSCCTCLRVYAFH